MMFSLDQHCPTHLPLITCDKCPFKCGEWLCFQTFQNSFIIFINIMFGSSQKSVEQKPLKDVNFLSIYVYVYKCMFVLICLHPRRGRCAKTEPSSYGSCETKNKQCGSCILTTKHVTQTDYYNTSMKAVIYTLCEMMCQ